MTQPMPRREFLKRGTAAGVLATTGLPAAALAAEGTPADALADAPAEEPVPGATERAALALADRQLDSREFCLSVYDAITPALTFTATNERDARRWQSAARKRVLERIGGLPAERVPLRAEVLETRDLGAYTRERVAFDTRPGLSAVGYLLLPKDRPRPLPAIVALPGHGRGVDDIVGLAPDGSQIADRTSNYSRQYAVQCAERGYAVLALEQLAFGARRDAAARRSAPTTDSCRPAACAALLFGQTMIGWRAWDAMRAIDYVSTRPEVDARRVATLGCSGGGTASLFTAALDERVKAAVVSAYFNTFRDSIVQISHCPDNYVPGLLQDVELYDLAGLVAPRALFVESGRNDRIFPVQGFTTAAEKARAIYQAFGAADRVGSEVHPGAHEFHGVGAFAFLERAL
jgi:dienelactone hydrolase